MTHLTIGQLSKATGVKVPTIRFYEQIGLMPEPRRTESDRRVYGDEAVERLRFVRHARQLGFEVKDVETLLRLSVSPDLSCEDVDALARTHLQSVDEKIAQLTALRSELARMVESCASGRVGNCRVIEALADHDLCESHQH